MHYKRLPPDFMPSDAIKTCLIRKDGHQPNILMQYGSTYFKDDAPTKMYRVCSPGGKTPTTDSFFNGRNYVQPFLDDLVSAKQSVVIATPKIKATLTSKVIQALMELMHRGVEVAISVGSTTLPTSDQEANREVAERLPIIQKDKQSYNYVVIDRSTIWYGDIPFLGYTTESSSAIRLVDSSVAEELIRL